MVAAGTAETVVVGYIAIVTFILTHYLGDIDRLWEIFRRERHNLAAGAARNSEWFHGLAALAKYRKWLIRYGFITLLACIFWLTWTVMAWPDVPRLSGFLVLSALTWIFVSWSGTNFVIEFHQLEASAAGDAGRE